ncbi:MAG: radical SAM protein [Acidobacteriota bacterium]
MDIYRTGMNPGTFNLVNGSCHRRQEEIAAVKRFLVSNRWREEGGVNQADLVIFFACGAMRLNVDEMMVSLTDVIGKMKNGAELVVGGCLPRTDSERLSQVFTGKTITYADYTALDTLPGVENRFETLPKVFGNGAFCPPLVKPGLRKAGALRLVRLSLDLARVLMRHRPTSILRRIASRLRQYERMVISVGAGCSRTCPYCAKRFALGPVRSKPAEKVMQRIAAGRMLGYRTFDLFADSIGDYGQDLGTDFGALLDSIADFEAAVSVGIYDLHPEDFIRYFDRILGLCKTDRLHYLYVITESGNARVLRSMRREIDTVDLARKLQAIRGYKSVFMQTAIIVGYPGETDEEFDDTLALLGEVNFDNVYVHCYCDMPNTESSRLDGKISKETVSRRLRRIAAAGIRHSVSEARRECDHSFPWGSLG